MARVFLIIFAAIALQGCFGGSQPPPLDPNATGVGAAGSYEICSYTGNLSDSNYSSARLSYPCDLSQGPYPATTLTGGFTNTKEQMYWLADHLTSHGYVVITMTPSNILGTPPVWKRAHLAGFARLEIENARAGSPVHGRINTDQRAIMGFSMGGGGTLLAAGELGTGFTTAIALAPWLGGLSPDYRNINEPVMVLGSANDTLAFASTVGSYYESLPVDITRMLAIYRDSTHFEWYGSGDEKQKTKFKILITAWMNWLMKDDAAARSYLDGVEHNRHLAEDWFTRYDFKS
ncbi:MAG: hypothetical protein ACK4SX_00345 [Alcanivoracaceae bacterium]